jgi:hypothetical protein
MGFEFFSVRGMEKEGFFKSLPELARFFGARDGGDL